ncbi:DNA-processing protein DprA [Microbacterium sp. XT11]|uniref:DNA-processing protein DprA n=1 Tax=Microbacterium sp. XT11 TaxID=367477 RepID=UPI0009F9E63F|nr:DNA-processing protein DprA [Microbacterium sp. XT11]
MIAELRADARVRRAVEALRDGSCIDDAIARAAWSVIAEPGDGDAGAVIAHMGATDALLLLGGEATPLVSPGVDRRRLREAIARWLPRAKASAVKAAVMSATDVGARLVLPGDAAWPVSVDDLGDNAPAALWVRGDPGLLEAAPKVALVGARAATSYGEMLAGEFAGDLAASGAVIVSGGAYGIDGAAHRAALQVQGKTIAFLAGGIDRPYPQGHRELLRRISEVGAVVSEVPCGTAPTKWRFLARNRLIAAVSDATVVVEAGWRSGSLNTAGHAASLGRPLGAVPGPVTSAASSGCHRLLREYDATCVTTVGEIRELWGEPAGPAALGQGEDRVEQRLLDALSTRTGITTSEIARRSGLAPEQVSARLGFLELDGRVRQVDGGWRLASAKR